jgi:hypothetical protein
MIGFVIFTHESSHHTSVPIVKTIFLGKIIDGIVPGGAAAVRGGQGAAGDDL